LSNSLAHFAKLGERVSGQHDVLPDVEGRNFACEPVELRVRLRATGGMKIFCGQRPNLRRAPTPEISSRRHGIFNLARREPEFAGQRARFCIGGER
jgi:hypothetical protein